MHIVFIVGSYYPYYSAVSKCVANVAEVLSKNHEITIICEKTNLTQSETEIFNDQQILRIVTKDKIKIESLNNSLKEHGSLKKNLIGLMTKIIKIKKTIKFILSKVSIKKELVDAYLSKLIDLNQDIDIIIPASMPFESVVAASIYKKNINKKTMLLPYLFDKFTDSKTLHRCALNRIIKRKTHILYEKEILEQADKVLAMHTLEKFYKSECPSLKNIVYLEHPLLISNDYKGNKNSAYIKIAYVGSFIKKYVEPDYLLRTFYLSKIKGQLSFYIMGNCSRIINKYVELDPERISNFGKVDKETATIKIMENDILISVAEKSGQQLSSKIFDYISMGKPIVHFYCFDDDVNKKILERYPMVLFIKEDKNLLLQNIVAFEKFCNEYSDKTVSWDIISRIYPEAMPVFTASLIESFLGEV